MNARLCRARAQTIAESVQWSPRDSRFVALFRPVRGRRGMSFLSKIFGGGSNAGADVFQAPEWASFFDGRAYLEFVELVEKELQSRGISYELSDGIVLAKVVANEAPHQWGLQNLSQLCHQ